jgi:cobalt-zinc-cadmium efflux system protein
MRTGVRPPYDDCQMTRDNLADRPGGAGHEHGSAQGDSHAHDHSHAVSTRRLAIALVITALFVVAEVVGGLLSNSVALLADAGHMLTDVFALGLSLFVARFSRQPATPRRTYGYLRWEIIAALINGAVLLVLCAWILVESVQRLRDPQPVVGGLMLAVAVGGLLVNSVSAWLLHGSASTSLNLRGAYLHVLSDLLGSVAVIVAAAVVLAFGFVRADPIASILVTLMIIRGAWRLVHEAVDVLLESTPREIELEQVRAAMAAVRGVSAVHDLHVWALTSGVVALSAHAIAPTVADHPRVLADLHAAVAVFRIRHVTIQLEGEPLAACSGESLDSPLSPANS